MNKIERIAEVRGVNAENRTAEFVISVPNQLTDTAPCSNWPVGI
jgi:hypothetical protein